MLLMAACAEASQSTSWLDAPCDPTTLVTLLIVDRDQTTDATDVVGVTSDGTSVQLTRDGISGQPSFSPDGTKILFTRDSSEAAGDELWIMSSDGSGAKPFLDLKGVRGAAFDPSGEMVAASMYEQDVEFVSTIIVVMADGSRRVRLSPPAEAGTRPIDQQPQWSRDGTTFAFVRTFESESGSATSQLWTSTWPVSTFHLLYTGVSIDDLAWGSTRDELLFTDWIDGQTFDPADRRLFSVNLKEGQVTELAQNASGAAQTSGGVIYFEFEPTGRDRNTLMMTSGTYQERLEIPGVNAVSGPYVAACP